MMFTSGPPRLNGLLLPYCSQAWPLSIDWDSGASTWRRYDGGREELKVERNRAVVRMGWQGLDAATAGAIVQELRRRGGLFSLIPRTKLGADPEWASEVEMEMRLTSPVPGAKSPATGLVDVVIEARSVLTYAALPGVIEGGFARVAEIPGATAVEATGDATWQAGTQTFTLLGKTYTVPTRRPWPPPVSALRARPGSAPYRTRFTLDT